MAASNTELHARSKDENEDRNEVTAKICKNCQVVFPKEYDVCPKCAVSTIIAFGK